MAISIKVDEAVQEWMKKKNRTIIAISLKTTLTCCMGEEDVDISYKEPQDNNFTLIQQNNLFIYLAKGLPLRKEELHLSMMGKSIFSSIHIDGLKVQ